MLYLIWMILNTMKSLMSISVGDLFKNLKHHLGWITFVLALFNLDERLSPEFPLYEKLLCFSPINLINPLYHETCKQFWRLDLLWKFFEFQEGILNSSFVQNFHNEAHFLYIKLIFDEWHQTHCYLFIIDLIECL